MSSPSRSSPTGFSGQALCLPIITLLALSGCLGPEGTTSSEGVDVSASADGEESDTPCGPEFSLTLPTGPNDTGSPCDPLKGPKTCNHLCLPIEAGEESTKQGGGICVDVCFDDECPTDFRCNTMPWGEKLCLPNLSCGDLTYEGVCEGSTLTYCDYEGSVTRECSDTLGADAEPMTCAWVPGVGHDCVSASYATSQVACGSVPYEGLCDEMGQLVYCGANETGGETLISVDCAALGDGQVCARAEDGFSSCTPKGAKPCGAVTYFGHCEGQTLVQCNGGFLEERDCAEEGLMCAFQEDAVGFSCISPSSEEAKGTMSVSASFAFEKPLAGLAGLNLSAPIQVPIRNALVTVNKVLDDTEIARAYTDDAGTVTFELSTSEALIMRVLTLGHVDSHPFVVTDCPMDDCDGSAGNTYALESEAFSASEEHTTLALTLATLDSGVAGAFNIFEVLLRGTHFAVQHFGAVPPTHFARWLSGSSTICPGGTSCFLKDTLYITSSDADTDEFDDAVILHEYGHFLEHVYGNPETSVGAHDGDRTDPVLAWKEGFGTYIACSVNQSPIYVDTFPGVEPLVVDIRTKGSSTYPANPTTINGMNQLISEFLVAEILWKLTKGPQGIGGKGEGAVLSALSTYLPGADFVDRGVKGVDLVDFLDGWFYSGQGDAPYVSEIVLDDAGFPYDFNGPNNCE